MEENTKLKNDNASANKKILQFENELSSTKLEIEKIKLQLGIDAETKK